MAYLITLATVLPVMIFFIVWIITQDIEYAITNAVVNLLVILAIISVVGVMLYFGIIQP